MLDSPAAVAEWSDVVITILPDTPDVERVLMGENGVLQGITAGKLVLDMSSISPIETKDMAAAFAAKGADYVDASISGGEVGAKKLIAEFGSVAGVLERIDEGAQFADALLPHRGDHLAALPRRQLNPAAQRARRLLARLIREQAAPAPKNPSLQELRQRVGTSSAPILPVV